MHFGLLDEFAAGEQFFHVCGCLELTLVGTNQVNGLGEGLDAAVVGVKRHGGNLVGPVAQALGLEQRPHCKRTHVLGAVEQCQTFFAGQFNGFPAFEFEQFGGGHHFAFIFYLAQAYQRQTHVCQWHEVARSAQRALTVNHGNYALVEEVDEALHGVEFAARVAVAQRLDLEQQHDANDFVRHAFAHAARMRHHQVNLQL